MKGNYYTLPNTRVIPWWQRLLLNLLPTHVAINSPVAIFYKVWRGMVYVIGEEQLPPIDLAAYLRERESCLPNSGVQSGVQHPEEGGKSA